MACRHGWRPGTYLRTLLASYLHLAPDLLAYQAQICTSSRKFKSTAWLMYDTAFRHTAASNVLAPWSKVNEQLYSDILKEETLPLQIKMELSRAPDITPQDKLMLWSAFTLAFYGFLGCSKFTSPSTTQFNPLVPFSRSDISFSLDGSLCLQLKAVFGK